MNETIAAISTPFGEGAIAVLRLSGPRAVEISGVVFRGKRPVAELAPRTQHLGAVQDGERKLDDVLLTVFRAPHSYTGEDVIEIACHGGVLVTRRILEVLLHHGARSAEPGEFTQRAYLNHKMDLTQAEAVMDLISAQTDLAMRAATEQLEGRLGERIRALRETLIELLAHIEAYIDFPDEDIDPATGAALLAKLDAAEFEIDELLATTKRGKVLREGARTVIYGAPNVGKSSLLNLLLGQERAIVSARPGTTRDVIEETIDLGGIPIRLIDTAGVRESDDEIEQEGMKRTWQQVDRADLILHVVDATQARPNEETWNAAGFFLGREYERGRAVLVLNKCDLGEHRSWTQDRLSPDFSPINSGAIRMSCLQGEGIEALTEKIARRVMGTTITHRDWSLAINARHADCLWRARGFAEAARGALTDGLSPEFVAEELRGALDAVGEVVGKADSEEILGKIFSTFCIGK
ncbi:MAG: tRNA uridine-5-carboxymethylaminomethyl(34) synthesis GTPase MnmE [Chthoniobacter sp.]|nr:tRNA uridine-5-carboxymethylaminomethyl(34) synthesis GTPase MnmE [Chthoniobacter sp.]